MRKLKYGIWVCLIVLLGSMIHAAVYTEKIQDYEYAFTFIAPLKWFPVVEGIQDADKEWNTNTKLVSFSNLNEENYVQSIRDAILAGTDGIVAAGYFQGENMRRVISEADDAGIPVVLIDSDLPESARKTYIGTDNRKAGQTAAERMIRDTGGKAKIAIITADKNTPNQKERIEGFEESIEKESGMEVVSVLECHSNTFELTEKVTKLLSEHEEIDALFLTESVSGSVVGNILQQYGDRQIYVAAFDHLSETCRFIEEEVYEFSLMQEFYEEGYLAVRQLKNILQGEKAEDTVYTDTVILDQSNLDLYERNRYKECEWILYE